MAFSPYDFGSRLQCVLDVHLARALGGHLWQNAGKTIPATADGDPVKVYIDPYTQKEATIGFTDAARPILKQDGSGVWFLRGNAAQGLTFADVTANLPCSMAYRWAAAGYVGSGYSRPASYGLNQTSSGLFDGQFFVYTSTGALGGTVADALAHNYVANWSTVTNQATGRVDGSGVLTGTNASGSGTGLSLLWDGATAFAGDMYKAIALDGALAGAELANVEAWLTAQDTTLPELKYFMPTFLQANQYTGLPLVIMQSRDATAWVRKNPSLVSFTPSSYDGTSGDYACRRTTGGYWMAYTRTRDADLCGMDTWGLSRSVDGFTWYNLPDVDVSAITGIEQVWAPEPFTDHDGKVYWMFSGSLVDPHDAHMFQVYCMEQLTFTDTPTFGTPWLMLPGLATFKSYIDAFMVYTAGAHYLFVKNNWSGLGHVELFKSTTGITGTFSPHRLGDWTGCGALEGPAIVEIASGWRLWGDKYLTGEGMHYSDQTAGDWTSGGSTTWSAMTVFDGATGVNKLRHGTPAFLPPAYDRRRRLLLCRRR